MPSDQSRQGYEAIYEQSEACYSAVRKVIGVVGRKS